MNKLLIALTLLTLSGLAAANESRPGDDRQQGQQQLLTKIRALESHSHKERIRILQKAEGCIQAAKSLQDYRSCEQEEHEAREHLRETQRPQHEALREQAKQMRNPPQATAQARP